MPPALATQDELEAYLQRPVPDEAAAIALRLASGKVRGFIRRDIPALADADSAPDDIKAVVLALAGRIVTNPTDLRQEVAGAQSATYSAETIGVQLTESDKEALRVYRPGMRMIQLVRPCWTEPG